MNSHGPDNLPERDHEDLGTQRPTRVLSVQTPILGNVTYGRLIREYLADTPVCRVESVWVDEDKDLPDRVLNRLFSLNLPSHWVGRRNLDLRRFRTEVGHGLLARRQALRQMRRWPCDVLHFHTQVAAYLSLDLMRRLPTVLSGDMTSALVAKEAPRTTPHWTFAPNISLEKRLYRAAAHIVSFSDWAARSVIEDYGIDPAKVTVINPGVKVAAFPPPIPHDPADPVRILFVGSDFARKGGFDLLEVFRQELAGRAELHLVTAAPLDAGPNVHVHRDVKAYSPEWLALYAAADIFALPTRDEALGHVFMEAMAAGLPVVATRLNAIPEMVTDGETGLLIATGDRRALAQSLRTLIDDINLRRRMGQAGRASAERRFDAEASFRHLGAVFAHAGTSVDKSQGLPLLSTARKPSP